MGKCHSQKYCWLVHDKVIDSSRSHWQKKVNMTRYEKCQFQYILLVYIIYL